MSPGNKEEVKTSTPAEEVPEKQEEEKSTSAEVEELREQLKLKQEEMLRKQADFANFRRISREEKEEVREYALTDFLGKLLPVLDNMERAIDSAREKDVPPSYLEGLEMIHKQFLQVLEQEGVTAMEPLGQNFDPNYHHAVLKGEDSEGEPGTVVDELQKGYMYKKRVLRPAMVKVC